MALDRLAKSDGNPLAIPVLVHHKQLIVSFRRVFSTRLLTLRATIVRPSPLRRATTLRYRSVGGDPARSEPTYVRVCSLWSNSIDSSSAHGDCRFFNQGEHHAICCPSLVRKLDPAQAHTTSCQSVVPGFARLFLLARLFLIGCAAPLWRSDSPGVSWPPSSLVCVSYQDDLEVDLVTSLPLG